MSDFTLYLITDRHQAGGRALAEVVRLALEGGVTAVQLREKDLSGAELYRVAVELRRITSDFGARFLINDRTDLALAVDADGVHIGVNNMPVATVRRVLGQGKIIGYSAHAIDEALCAQADGADFVTFGPVYSTPSKLAFGAPCGVRRLAEAATALTIPVIALGGINQANISETLAAPVRGVAVISAVLAAADSRSAASFLLKKIEEHAQHC